MKSVLPATARLAGAQALQTGEWLDGEAAAREVNLVAKKLSQTLHKNCRQIAAVDAELALRRVGEGVSGGTEAVKAFAEKH
eukprot:COSAG05_NODE_16649_length_341_cov_1.235537_1_plen_80_part_01